MSSDDVVGGLADTPPPYDTIVFDCDSTLSTIEGIDELAGPETRAAVEALTKRAMAGELALERVYGERLALIAPTFDDVDLLAQRYADAVSPDSAATIKALRRLGKTVAVVSGGILGGVRPFARSIGVDPALVFAVEVYFDDDGTYAGYDERSPLARSDGKPEIVAELSARYGPVAVVGDGTTDLSTAGAAARFVAFAGVVSRAAVVSASRCVVTRASLAATLPHLLTDDERERVDPALFS